MEDILEIFYENKLMAGRMISGSKSGYRNSYPDNLVYFNANIIIDGKKQWYGDIDVTLEKQNLLDVAKELNKDLYILSEMDARFENEETPLIENYQVKITLNGEFFIKTFNSESWEYEESEMYINEELTISNAKNKII